MSISLLLRARLYRPSRLGPFPVIDLGHQTISFRLSLQHLLRRKINRHPLESRAKGMIRLFDTCIVCRMIARRASARAAQMLDVVPFIIFKRAMTDEYRRSICLRDSPAPTLSRSMCDLLIVHYFSESPSLLTRHPPGPAALAVSSGPKGRTGSRLTCVLAAMGAAENKRTKNKKQIAAPGHFEGLGITLFPNYIPRHTGIGLLFHNISDHPFASFGSTCPSQLADLVQWGSNM